MSTARNRPAFSPGDSIIVTAIALSIAVHAILLAFHFVDPSAIKFKPIESLEVVLVNAKSKSKPVKATVLAQSDLNGGGDNDKGHASSYLPNAGQTAEGDVLQQSNAAVARLEEEQRQLMTQMGQTPVAINPNARVEGASQSQNAESHDAEETRQQMLRQEAIIDREIRDYNERPKRGYIAPNTRGVGYANYYTEWKSRIERLGSLAYPPDNISGNLVLRVTLRADGSIYRDEIEVVRSSGYPVLDRAAVDIVRHGAPYAPFPPEMKRDGYDVWEIYSKFIWSKGSGFAANLTKR